MFNLTRQERAVLLFLGTVVFFGLGIDFSLKKFPQIKDFYIKKISSQDKIDINKASYQELINIPYIGPATANHIIQLRNQTGNFKSIDELKDVKGLNQKKLGYLKNFIFISD